MTIEAILIVLAIGAAGGFQVGRSSAESSRARHDMNKVWDNRANYRDRKDK